MKKVLSLFIVAGLFSAFMVGCGAPAETPAETAGATTAGAAPAADGEVKKEGESTPAVEGN